MNARRVLFLGAALAAVIAAIVLFESETPQPVSVTYPDSAPENSAPSAPSISSAPAENVVVPPPSGADATTSTVEDIAWEGPIFRTSAAGDLLLDERTRLSIESLVAQTEARELYTAVREQTEELPPAAAKAAEELVEKFVGYQQAQRHAFPPDNAPLTPEEAIRELEGLHALREAHFGPDVARKFYGQEEVIAREMIEVMRVENDQSLTPEEKTERARALRERLLGVSAIERNNRNADAQPEQRK